MIEMLKKTVLAGIGAGVVTKELVEDALQEMVQKGKMSTAEAQGVVERISRDAKTEYADKRTKLVEYMEHLMDRAHIATAAEVEALRKRVAALELQMNELQSSQTPPAAPAVTPRLEDKSE